MAEITLEEAIKQFNEIHKDLISPAAKTAKLDILSYKTMETDNGPQQDPDTFETVHYDLKVYEQNNYANSFIAIHRSKHADTKFEVQLMHLEFCGPDRGCCISFMRLGDLESEGINVTKSAPTKVDVKTAAELFATGKYMLMVKRGKKFEYPAVATFSFGMEE